MRLAQGQVRCGACLTVFSANKHALQRVSEQSEIAPAPAPSVDKTPDNSTATKPSYSSFGSSARVVQFENAQPAARQTAVAPSTTPLPEPRTEHREPSFDPAMIPQIDILAEPIVLHQSEPYESSPVAILFWTLCSLVALAGMLGQYLWFERASLANQPALAPFYQIACERIRCDLNPSQGLASLKPDQVVVRPHQQFNDLISLAIRIRNDAAFAQPYPAIEVSFSDLKGNLVSRRTFQPQQYLGGDAIGSPRLPAGLDIEVNLPLTAPGEQAVSYEIRLHQTRT